MSVWPPGIPASILGKAVSLPVHDLYGGLPVRFTVVDKRGSVVLTSDGFIWHSYLFYQIKRYIL